MHTTSLPQKRAIYRLISALEHVVVGVVSATFFVRLSHMQLDGFLTFGGAILALAVALTSLMFNRARAYPDGALQRRTLLAAELGLRSTLLLLVGAASTAMIFPFVQAFGYQPTSIDKLPTEWGPIIGAIIPFPFVIAGSLMLLKATRVIAPSLLKPVRARHLKVAAKKPK